MAVASLVNEETATRAVSFIPVNYAFGLWVNKRLQKFNHLADCSFVGTMTLAEIGSGR